MTAKTKKNNGQWTSIVEDAGDGSGDAIITIPDELLEQLQWDENTELLMSINEYGVIVLEEAKD